VWATVGKLRRVKEPASQRRGDAMHGAVAKYWLSLKRMRIEEASAIFRRERRLHALAPQGGLSLY